MFRSIATKGLQVFVVFSLLYPGACLAGDIKVSGTILAHREKKVRPPGISPFEHARKLRRMGLNPRNLSSEDCALYVERRLRPGEIAQLGRRGVVVHGTYVPPVAGKHEKGFHLATVAYASLNRIREDSRFVRLESTELVNKPLNDLAAQQTKVDRVHAADGVVARTGLGVRIAIADSGLDLTHGDIPTPAEAYDMTDGTGPSSWGADVTNLVTSHGTHVTGSAVGSGALSGGDYIGAAPGATLYFYKIGDDSTGSASDTDIIEAINRAQAQGCDIFSMSYGGYSTFMDGSASVCQAIDAAAAAGMTCFLAAGNEPDNAEHYSVEVPPGATSSTFGFTISNSNASAYTSEEGLRVIWIDGLSDENVVLTCLNLGPGESLTQEDSDVSSRGTEAKEFVLIPNVAAHSSKTYNLTLANSAGGGAAPRVHIYHIYGEGTFDNADASYTVLYPALADDAIAVGAWTQRKSWTNYKGADYYYSILTVETLAPFSSLGPRIDGVMKPDVVAPGAATISARDSDETLTSSQQRIIDNDGLNLDGSGPANYYISLGTSMACPHAAGLAALVLEAKPSLSPAELELTLTSTASMAHSPDNSVGSGLLDALAAIGEDTPPTITSTAIRGVSYTAWEPDTFSSPTSDASLEAALDDGCNWIAICVWEFQDTATSTEIAPDYDSYSATPESVADAIRRCHELGINVMLKPMIDCKSCSWRGEIQPSAEWFTAYQGFVNRWAQVARDNSVEMFCVGCELRDTVSWSASWRGVIGNARLIYSGPLVYAANHGNEQNIDWWDELDLIGIDAYYPLTAKNNPTPDELAAAWNSRLDSIEAWRSTDWPAMDIVFTEVGYQSTDGTNQTPFWTDPATNPIDLLEQADCYEALLNQCKLRPWWLGAFWWNWETDPDAGGPGDPYWTPQNKPAEVILHDYYTATWRWNDGFVAAFVDAEGINRHPDSTHPGEQFEGQVLSVTDVSGPGAEIVYSLLDSLGNPVDNSVAGLEVWKPDGANWLGQGPTSGLRLVEQWSTMLNMDASPFESLEIPLWYVSGVGALDVRAFCVTGTSSGAWVETQLDSQVVTLTQGQSTVLKIDLTSAGEITRMVKVGVVVEAHDDVMEGEQATLHIGATTSQTTVALGNYGTTSNFRWKDVAGQLYSAAYQSSYTYDEARVQVSFNTVGAELAGTLTATNLKPNFAYQFKLIGTPIHQLGDTNYGANELIGLNGRWWQQEWLGSSWNSGWNLNSKGDGSFPNPNDQTYWTRRDIADDIAGSPTGLKYKYSAYRVFDYFITDEFGSAALDFTVDSSYHVLWGTWQGSPGANDGPLASHSFDVNPAVHPAYDTDYGPASAGVFGEWERLPMGGIGLRAGHYKCDLLLTEESFHENGLGGFWAHAMHGAAEFDIVSSGLLLDDNFDDGDYSGWTIVDEGALLAPSDWSAASGTMIQNSDIYSTPTTVAELGKVGTYAYYAGGLSWTDYQLDLTIRTETDNDDIGVMFRYQDSDNYYRFSWGRQRSYRRLVKKEGGVFSLLAEDSVPYVAGQTYQIRIIAQGALLQVSIDGAPVFSVTDGAITSGSIALYTWGNKGSCFDDIIVGPLSGGNLPPTISSVTATPSTILDTQTSQLQVVASDPDSGPGPLTYNWTVQPGEGGLDDSTIPNPVYTPPDVGSVQAFTLTVEVSDGEDTTTDTVNVTVTDADSPVLLDDNFDDGDYSGWTIVDEGDRESPSAWSAASGTMVQSSNIYSSTGLGTLGTYAYYAAGLNWTDYQADLTIRSQDDDAIGMMFRYQDNDNYYRFSWDKSRNYRRLVKKEAGVFSLLAEDSVHYVAGQTYQIRIIAQGASLTISIDGAPIFSVTDGAVSAGSIALYTWGNKGSYFDDVAVGPLSGGNLPPTISSVTATPSTILDTQTSQLQVVASDPDSGPGPLTYNWTVQPGEGGLDDSTIPNPVYTPPDVGSVQAFTLTVEVSDGEDTTTDTVNVTVTDADSPVLLDDNFDDGDYSGWTIVDEGDRESPSAWSAASGTMVQNSDIYSTPTTVAELSKVGTYAYYAGGLSWTDYQLDLTIRTETDNDDIGVMFRYQDSDNYYRFSWGRQRSYRRLVKKEGGVFSLLAEDSVPYVAGQTYQIRIIAQGALLQVSIDGAPVFSVTDGAISTGSIALYTWGNKGSCFDDVVVGPLSGGNLPPTISSVTATPSTIPDTQTSQLQVVASDPDAGPGPLTYNWTVQPGEGGLDDSTIPNPVYTPPDVGSVQAFTLTVEVSDGEDTTTDTVNVTVTDADSPVLLDDNFDDGDYSGWTIVDEGDRESPSAWSAASGTMVQSSNIYSLLGGELAKPGTYAYYSAGLSWTDYQADLTIRSQDDDAIGMMFRYQDNDNYYRFSWDKSRNYRRLVKKEAGVFSLLAEDSVHYVAGQTYQIRIIAQGASLTISIDGAPIFSVTDGAVSAGSIALYTWGNKGSYFDDVAVESF